MDDRSGQIRAIAITCLAMSITSALLRVYVRYGMLRSFGMDDWLMMVTLVSTAPPLRTSTSSTRYDPERTVPPLDYDAITLIYIAYVVFQITGTVYGIGRPEVDIANKKNREIALQLWWLCEIFYVASSAMLKMSLGAFLLRVTIERVHIWILWFLMVGTGLFGIFYEGIVIFQCRPISAFWTVAPNSEHCLSAKVILGSTYTAATLNALVDWTVGILPYFIIRSLQMPTGTKVLVISILAFAAIGSTATAVRIKFVEDLGTREEFLWRTSTFAILSTVEIAIGITAGCMATLRPLLQIFLRRIGVITSRFGTHSPSSRTHRSNNKSAPELASFVARAHAHAHAQGTHGVSVNSTPVGGIELTEGGGGTTTNVTASSSRRPSDFEDTTEDWGKGDVRIQTTTTPRWLATSPRRDSWIRLNEKELPP
ncbi:hypothetical protein AJ80_01527 [Polytolypa hystricis UAMH7299]|uniref:Rhodopsin domain-containing protein n=1 Tax=Polytolypa hystricis (strain UAMH7299) TaxID=1447883 RepID=A0A2B7Z0L0_POLH7|nr:hypothetical protein AJ80_01527 [Polytolypa hystricis UAMH7299]